MVEQEFVGKLLLFFSFCVLRFVLSSVTPVSAKRTIVVDGHDKDYDHCDDPGPCYECYGRDEDC